MKEFKKKYVQKLDKYKMLHLPQLKQMIKLHDCLISIDIQDTYLHIPIHPASRKYLLFQYQGQHYQWTVLPYGIAMAQWLLTLVTKPIVAFLHNRGDPLRLLFGWWNSSTSVSRDTQVSTELYSEMIYQPNWVYKLSEPSDLQPSQDLKFLWIRFLTGQNRIQVPEDCWIQSCLPAGIHKQTSVNQW